MSSDTPDDDRAIAEIAPDDFLDTWGASSYSEGLKKAANAPTTTPDSERPRCPECGIQRVYPKPDKDGMKHRKDGSYRCAKGHHFDEPVYGDPDELDLREEDEEEAGEDADNTTDRDPFVWVDPDGLAEPPFARQLAALDDDTLAALAIFLYRPWNHTDDDPSYRELGRIFPYSRTWVGDRVREWEDGDLRDLVADPRPRVNFSGGAGEVSAE